MCQRKNDTAPFDEVDIVRIYVSQSTGQRFRTGLFEYTCTVATGQRIRDFSIYLSLSTLLRHTMQRKSLETLARVHRVLREDRSNTRSRRFFFRKFVRSWLLPFCVCSNASNSSKRSRDQEKERKKERTLTTRNLRTYR